MNSEKSDALSKELFRVVVSRDANEALEIVLSKVNAEWDAGKVTRPQLVSHILLRFQAKLSERDIQEIRSHHFDKVAYLESLLKRARETGQLPPELDPLFQDNGHASKRAARLTKNITNGDVASKESSNE